MARPGKLTPEQWAVARRRWEGCPAAGFDWLVEEIAAAFDGVVVTRQGASVRAKRDGWVKCGEPSSPLAVVAKTPDRSKVVARTTSMPAPMTFDCIPTVQEIAEASFSVGDCAAIYFLLKHRRVVYVGQSKNVFTRIGQHMRDGAKDFDSVSYMPCGPELMNSLETLFIHIFRPALNSRERGTTGQLTPINLRSILRAATD